MFPISTPPSTSNIAILTLSVLSVAIVSASILPIVRSFAKVLAIITVLPDFILPIVALSLISSKFTLNLAFIWVFVVTLPTFRTPSCLAVKFMP